MRFAMRSRFSISKTLPTFDGVLIDSSFPCRFGAAKFGQSALQRFIRSHRIRTRLLAELICRGKQFPPMISDAANRVIVRRRHYREFRGQISQREVPFLIHSDVLQHAGAHLFDGAIRRRHQADAFRTVRFSMRFSQAALKIRFTKILGVWISSGGISPTSTSSSTSAMVTLAAVAIIGLKLRAVLRYTRFPQRSPFHAL